MAAALFAGASCPAAWAGPEEDIRRAEARLRSLEERIARIGEGRDRRRKRAETILDQMDRLAGWLAVEDQRLRLLNRRLRDSERRLGLVRGRIKGLEREREGRAHRLRGRLRGLYMSGPASGVRLIVMARSVWDIIERWSLVTLLTRYDLRLIEGYRRAGRRLRRLEAEAEAEVRRRAGWFERRARVKRRLAGLYGRRAKRLARLEGDKDKRARLLDELEEARDALRDAITSRQLERAARGDSDAAAMGRMQGRLAWPVEGRALPRRKSGPDRQGVRILAPMGAAIRSVAAGEVVFSDWVRGYGLLLILRHSGEIYTVYGGAGDVLAARGARVRSGQVIARVGATSALGAPSLYFEIRKGAIPLDPLRWLSPLP